MHMRREAGRHGVMLIFKPTKSGLPCIEDKYNDEIGIRSTAEGQHMKMMMVMRMNGAKKKRKEKN